MKRFLGKIYDNQDPNSWATNLRNQRFNFFKSLIAHLSVPIKILDVGGRLNFWENVGFLAGEFQSNIDITLLNMSFSEVELADPRIKCVVGDARNMKQFKENEFDVVFSNSVIEHVGDYGDQLLMANEIMRVGKRYFVQTPNLYFLIEPHFVFPFFQFLPRELRVWLITNFQLGWYEKFTDEKKAWEIVNEIRLLSKREFMTIFPEAEVYEEKVFGLTKSLISYGGWN